jgi:flagellar protein FliS
MSTPLATSPNAYRASAVLTASPQRLVVMLYDGARRFLHQAAVATAGGDIQMAHIKLCRAEAIIQHLQDTLDLQQGDVALRLRALYLFFSRHLNAARVERDPAKIEQVSKMLGELREAWATIEP